MTVVSVQGPDQKIYQVEVPDSFLSLNPEDQKKKLDVVMPSLLGIEKTQPSLNTDIVDPAPEELQTIDTTGRVTPPIELTAEEMSGEDVGTFKGLYNALGRGANDLQNFLSVTKYQAGIIDEKTLSDELTRDYIDKQQYPRPLGVEEGLADIQKQTTLSDAAIEAVKNPDAVIDVVMQSLVSSIPSLAGMFGGFFVAGPVGAGAGAGAGSFGVEYAHSLQDFMMEEGVNLGNSKEVLEFLGNTERMEDAKTYAAKRGLAIGAFDAVSAGLAGKFFLPAAKAVTGSAALKTAQEVGGEAAEKAFKESVEKSSKVGLGTIGTKTKALSAAGRANYKATLASLGAKGFTAGATAEVGAQAIAGGSGEFTAQLVTKGGMISPGDVVLEAFGEVVPGVAETTIGVALNEKNKNKLVDSNIVDRNDLENVDARYKPPTSDAPQGTSFIRENKDKETVEFFDNQNNTLGESSEISQNILKNNSDNILNDDVFEAKESKVFRVVKNGELQPNFYNSETEARKSANLGVREKKTVDLTSSEITEKKQKKDDIKIIKEESYVITNKSEGASYNIKGYKFSDKYKAQDVVDNLNNSKQAAIDNRNKDFQKTRALFSLVNKDKARVNAVNKTLKEKKIKAPQEKQKSFDDFTESEINNELKEIENNFISPEEYASVKKLIYNEINTLSEKPKTFTPKKIQDKLKLSKDKSKILYQELKNRNVLTTKNTVRVPQSISSKELGGQVIKQKQSEGLVEAIGDAKFTQKILGKSIEQAEKDITNRERESAASLIKARKREAAKNLNSTPKFLSNLKKIFAVDLKNRFIEMTNYNPKDVSINFLKTINTESQGAIIDISTNGKLIINIAAQGLEGQTKRQQEEILYKAIDEEAFHVIEELASEGKGPLSIEDVSYLKKQSRTQRPNPAVNQSYYDLAKETYKNIPGYRNQDGSINIKRIESEAMAGMFEVYTEYKRNLISRPPLNSRVGEIFSKLMSFFTNVIASLKRSDINKTSEVFSKIKEPTAFTENVAIDPNPNNLTGDALKAKIIFDDKVKQIQESGINPESKEAAVKALERLNYKNPENSFTLSKKAKERIKGIRQAHRKEHPVDVQKSMNETLGPANSDLISDGFFDTLKKLTKYPSKSILAIRKRLVDDLQDIKISSEEVENAADILADTNAYAASIFSRASSAIVGAALGSLSTRQKVFSGPPVYQDGITITDPVIVTIPVRDSSGNIIEEDVEVKGIADNIGEVLENRREEEFHLYKIAMRQIGLYKTNPKEASKQALSEEQAKRLVTYFEEKYPYFIESSKKMTGFTIKVNEYLYKTGQISLNEFEKRKSSPDYHPFYVDKGTINPEEFSTTIGYELDNLPPEMTDYKIDEEGNVRSSTDPKKLKGKGSLYLLKIDDKFLTDSQKKARYFKTRKGAEAARNKLPDNQKQLAVVEKTIQPIDSLMNNYVNWLQRSVSNGMRNVAAQRVIRDQVRIGAANVAESGEKSNASIWVNGQEVKFVLEDPAIHYALLSLMDNDMAFFESTPGRAATAPASLLRNLITKDPGFMAANFLRDSLSASYTSGRIGVPLWASIKGAIDASQNSPGKISLMRAGIRGGPDFAAAASTMGTVELENYRKRTYPKGAIEKATKPLKAIWDWAERLVEISDLATRIAVRNEVMEKTGNEAQAIWEGLEVLNFRKRGKWLKYFSPLIPFLNARAQGIDVFVRGAMGKSAARSAGLTGAELRKRFFVRASVLTSLSIGLYLLQAGDEEWDQVPQITKDNNYVVLAKYLGLPKDYEPLTIPGFFEVSLFLSVIPQRIVGQMLGEPSEQITQSLSRNLYSVLMPGAPTFVTPFLENAVNYDIRRAGPVLNQSEQLQAETDPSLVQRTGDSNLANALAGSAGLTGPEWQNILNDLFGKVGSYVIALTDSFIPSDTIRPTKKISELPIVSRFRGRNNAALEDMYRSIEILKSAKKNINELNRDNEFEKSKKIKSKFYPYLSQEYDLKQLNKTFQSYKKMQRNIRDVPTSVYLSVDPTYTPERIADDKRKRIDDLQKRINNLIPRMRNITKEIKRLERRQ